MIQRTRRRAALFMLAIAFSATAFLASIRAATSPICRPVIFGRPRNKLPLEIRKQFAGAPALAAAAGLQRAQDAHEVVVADPLEFADGEAGRLFVRLGADLLDQALVEVDHVGEPGPWPFEARAELGE